MAGRRDGAGRQWAFGALKVPNAFGVDVTIIIGLAGVETKIARGALQLGIGAEERGDPGLRSHMMGRCAAFGIDAGKDGEARWRADRGVRIEVAEQRSEEHTSELQSLMRISYAVFCLKKKNKKYHDNLKLKTPHNYTTR